MLPNPAVEREPPRFALRPPLTSTLTTMEAKHWAAAVLVFVAAVLYFLDRRIHRKAKRVQSSWNCIRCGVELDPMHSVDIRVAGGPGTATQARACLPCAARDKRIWWAGMLVIGFAFLGTITLLWPQ